MPIDLTTIDEPVLRAVFGYWTEKRGARQMPARRDLDPVAEVPRLAPYLTLVDTAPELGDFRFRLYGSVASAGFGEDRTGRALRDIAHIEHYDDVVTGYAAVRQRQAPLYTPRRPVSTLKNHCAYSRLLLPLSSDGREVDMILGAVVFLAYGGPALPPMEDA